MNKIKLITSLMITLSVVLWAEFSSDPAEKGLQISIKADKAIDGFVDQIANLTMLLKNKYGQESKRSIKIKTLEVKGDGDKSISIFKEPKDVKGTAFLTFTHKLGSDDQWLYLPALKRVKRISSANKSGSFMGSEFAYEDIVSQEIEKYKYKFIKSEELDGKKTLVVEKYPQYENSGYTRQVVWHDEENFTALKIDFYDRKNALLKTLTYKNYKEYMPNVWKAHEMHMLNHQSGKSTVLIWADYQFKNGLIDADFNKNSLMRVN